MTNKCNLPLIEAIQAQVPAETTPAALIADTLSLGREAAYRRLRGEVPFTFDEAAAVARRLDLSLDAVAGRHDAQSVRFRLKETDFKASAAEYGAALGEDARQLAAICADPHTVYAMAGNALPAEFYFHYPTLAAFRIFKWMYQRGLLDEGLRTFEQTPLPPRLAADCRAYVEAARLAAVTYCIIDDNTFRHWINAVHAFRAMHLISDETVARIGGELAALVDELERIAIAGAYPNGNEVFLYLSDVDIESTYKYLQSGRCQVAYVGLFMLNALRTTDAVMFGHVKRWIATQTRFATLVSRSGEMQRIRYFKRQREVIGEL